ncbi:MAG: CxxC-x17-CxxC domain-containing protein, partial [Anaerovibrio sp.]
VVCAQCGKETEVPFEPKNDRPVYCRDCFQARKNG